MGFDIKRIKYEKNVGSKDQQIRYATGCLILLVALFKGNVFLLLLGIILVASGYTTWCPVLSGLDKNTLDNGN